MSIHDDFTSPGWTIELESGWDDDGWTRVPTNITRDTALSWKAKGLVAFLAGHTRGFRITREFIIGASSDGETSVRSGLKELRDAGYLTYRRGQGNNGAYVLRRFPTSAQPSGKPPMVVSTHVGNHGQRKTKFQVDQVEVDQEKTSSPGGDGALFDVPDTSPTDAGQRAVNRHLDEEFEGTFWPEYPRKVGKDAARVAYRAARRRGVTVEQAMDGLRRFVKEKADTEKRFIPHASTWLNAGRWADEPDGDTGQRPGNGYRPYQNDDYWK
jgi:hypothetical protein